MSSDRFKRIRERERQEATPMQWIEYEVEQHPQPSWRSFWLWVLALVAMCALPWIWLGW